MINVLNASDSQIIDHHRTSQTMNQKIDDYVHDISVRFFPEDTERCEELVNVLDDLVARVMIEYRKETEAIEYEPEEIKHG